MITETLKDITALGVNKSLPLYVSATRTKAWIQQGTTYYPLATCDINRIKPNSVARVSGVISYPSSGSIASKGFLIMINNVAVHQVFPVATTQCFSFEVYLYVSTNSASVLRAQTFIGTGVAALSDGTGNLFGSNTSGGVTTAAITLNGTSDTLTLKTRVQGTPSSNGEYHSLEGFTVELLNTPTPVSYNSDYVACWGDSLTAGTGATFGSTDYPHVLGKARIGKPFINLGIGGETAAQILTRFLADKVNGVCNTAVLWWGRNNVGSPTMQADVLSALASAVAALNHSRYIIMPVLNASTEPNGSANKIAIDALNAAIASTYPAANFLDIVAVICTEANGTPNAAWLSDTIHLNATGYAAVAASVDAKLTTNGW